MLPDWLAAVRLLQATIGTALSVTSYISIQTFSCKVLEKWGKTACPVRLHPLEWLSSEQTLQRGKQHFISRKAQTAEQTKLCKQEAALCKAERGRWAPVLGHVSAATVTLKWKWLSSLSSSFVSAPVQLQWRQLGPSLWLSEDSWSLEDRERPEIGRSDRDVKLPQCSVQADPCFVLNIKETNNNDNKIIIVGPIEGKTWKLPSAVVTKGDTYRLLWTSKLQEKADFSKPPSDISAWDRINTYFCNSSVDNSPGSISRINPSWWATLSFQLLVLLAAVSNFFLTSWNKTEPTWKQQFYFVFI